MVSQTDLINQSMEITDYEITPIHFTEENLIQKLNEMSVECRASVIRLLNRPTHQKIVFKQRKQPKQPKQPVVAPKEEPVVETGGNRPTVKDTIDFLLQTENCKKPSGGKSKATVMLETNGVSRAWSSSHMYQVKHSQKNGSIKMIKSIGTSLGANNQLEGHVLDPYSHESVKFYLEAVKSLKAVETQGRGYLRAGLSLLDLIHTKFI